jgi:hypothetical protein
MHFSEREPRVSATTKFYSGFFLAVALVVVISFYTGYRMGASPHITRHAAVVQPRVAP